MPEVSMARPRIVLTMIVKDEAHVIERCIASVRPVIDAWCIVDTGSTDDTPDIVRRVLGDLPGELHHRPWVDFAHNRSEALELARPLGDYSLMIDADVTCEIVPGATIDDLAAELTADHHQVELDDGPIVYERPQLTSTHLDYGYRGVLHEFLATPDTAVVGPRVDTIRFVSRFDGARSRNPAKYSDDAEILRRALDAETDDHMRCRYQFYLAQSLWSAKRGAEALEEYRIRTTMGGWSEEIYISWLSVGRLLRHAAAPLSEVLDAFSRAFDAVPTRAEALCDAAEAARGANRMPTAYLFASTAASLPRPQASLFLEPNAYIWRSRYELSIAAWYVGAWELGARVSAELLAEGNIPEPERSAVVGNMGFYGGS